MHKKIRGYPKIEGKHSRLTYVEETDDCVIWLLWYRNVNNSNQWHQSIIYKIDRGSSEPVSLLMTDQLFRVHEDDLEFFCAILSPRDRAILQKKAMNHNEFYKNQATTLYGRAVVANKTVKS
jgi:hypothetical protein